MREKLEQNLATWIRKGKYGNRSTIFKDLIVAGKYDLNECFAEFLDGKPTCMVKGKFSDEHAELARKLPKPVEYEIFKNTIFALFAENTNGHLSGKETGFAELISMSVFWINFFHDDKVVDVSSKQESLKIFKKERLTFRCNTQERIRKITCDKNAEHCVTLVLEEQIINVNSFILTDNSPVFKRMLRSKSFKEGLTKTIELPGKNLDDFLCFLRFLQKPKTKVINGRFYF